MNNRDEFNKRIESQIRETQNLMVEVRTTLQDMKEVLNLKKRVPQTRDCGTTPPPSPAKSIDKQTNLEDNQIKIERILEVIQEVSERISVKASEISVVHRASSPIMDSPTIVAKPTISETKLFQDQANQSDESLVTILPPKVTEDKCLETDFINLQIVEEMTNHCGLSIIDDIIYEDSDEDDEEMVEKPRQLTIQQLPSININRGLVVQTALKLDIEPTKSIDNGDQITNIGYKEFNKVEEQKLERSSPIPVDKIEEIATKSASCIDKDVQVSDLESVSSEFPLDVIEFVKKKYTDFVWVLNDNLDGDNEIELQISLDNTSKNSTPREELQKTIDLYSSQAIQCNLSANDYTDDEFEDEEIPVKDVSSSESQSTRNQTKFESFNPVDSEGDIIRIKRERELFNTTLIIPLREYQLLDLSNSESASMGEIYYNQCACSNVSIGEVHDCNYGIIQNALDIQKQKAIYRNWISYCLSRNVKIDDSSLSS